MNEPFEKLNERRLSVNNRNAYIVISSNDSATDNTNKTVNTAKKSDDSLYLTSKPAHRVRFYSEGSFSKSEEKSKEASTSSSIVSVTQQTKETAEKVQVGMDRYITIIKRGRSPNSSKAAPLPKISKAGREGNSQNRFALLASDMKEPNEAPKSFKPPPIYLREANTNDIIKRLVALIGANSFYVTRIKRGNLFEIKIQVDHEKNFRKIVDDFETKKKNFYTYQLKSAKGLQVVIKGIDSCVTPDEVREGLKEKGFLVKNVVNIKNREKVPQPLFRVELEPGDLKLKKNETHPIYELKYLLHRRVIVEEPLKRSGPIQCTNCQEYGHTRGYCKLPTVCVVCGELHSTAACNKSKDDSKAKKCSNCGGNHTANYRGCPIFIHVKQTALQKPAVEKVQPKPANSEYPPLTSLPVSNQFSYADILKTGQAKVLSTTKEAKEHATVPTTNLSRTGASEINFSRLETTIDNLVQTTNNFTNTMSHLLNNFTNSMGAMMAEMMKMQQMLMQIIVKNNP